MGFLRQRNRRNIRANSAGIASSRGMPDVRCRVGRFTLKLQKT